MRRITWNNLTPPGYQSEDIVNYLLKPAIFDNPELKDRIQASSFYIREKKGEKISFDTLLQSSKTTRTRLFSRPQNPADSKAVSERMLHLLLANTTSENVPYNMNSFPVRHEFKKQWMKLLMPQEKLPAEDLKNTETGDHGQGIRNNRRSLTKEAALYQKYICALVNDETGNEEITSLKNDLDMCSSGKPAKRNLENIDVQLCYNKGKVKVALSSLIQDIPPCKYDSSSYYADDEESAKLPEDVNVFFERLASLSVIASVWYIWENAASYEEELIRLANMIFPAGSLSVFNPSGQTNLTSEPDTENSDSKQAYNELQKVKALAGAHDYKEAGKLCEKIFLTYKNASDRIIAKALSYLIICCENNYPVPQYFKSISNIIREAINCGSSYISKEKNEIKNHPQASASESVGFYTINCTGENSICDWITQTAPAKWHKLVSSAPESTLAAGKNHRMLLVNDNYDINLQDAINILDKIKASITQRETKISDWQNLELYIRCNETEITPLLDTALSYFTEDTEITSHSGLDLIKIYLIDEAKRSADFLFAQHPHFYPLTLARNSTTESQCVHIVLASNNKDLKYSEWLIKEAFWTLPRFDVSISSKISVISPYAAELCHSIISECPGLAAFSSLFGKIQNPGSLDIEDINFPVIEYTNTSFSSQALQEELEKLWTPSEYLYYIVDASSDTEGINIAMRIREHTIRQSVLTGHSNNYSKYNAVIAVRCFNPDIAGLTKELIVPKEEEHGKQWFNDYNLITFGSKESIYSWDQLSGGIIETVSQCIHLQYCGSEFDNNSCSVNLNSYFKRLYNHDSSFGAAVSIPYRLYEAGVVPDTWFIQNCDAWWNKTVREELAAAYRDKINSDEAFVERLARYEHMRWCCFQLTRGWMPVEPYQVIQFISAGAPRHVLQIAKLHPCLCSWKKLADLHRQLSLAAMRKISWSDYKDFRSEEEIMPYLDKKFRAYYSFKEDYTYFQQIDYKNIEETDLIIDTAWDISGVKDRAPEK